MGIELILKIFSSEGLNKIFDKAAGSSATLSQNAQRIIELKDDYLTTIDPVIRFLQHKNPTLAYGIAEGDYLPQASRFDHLEDLDWAFGSLGIQDKARHLATLYLEDLGDLIAECVDPHFGFSRYAERIGRAATFFAPIHEALQKETGLIEEMMLEILDEKIKELRPTLVCMSIPFPGNLFAAFRCAQYLKKKYPQILIAMGGGYPNTELRSISAPQVFDYFDFITLDDGERPLLCLIEFLAGKREKDRLKRTFLQENGIVIYINGASEGDIPFSQTGTPDYDGLPIDRYLSVLEVANPMHRLWSDGRWNKLTMAHGCYWKKCSFCDISLDYIRQYDPVNASMICDRMEEMIAQTGETGFHFVDEAAPPALMKELAIEILKRKLTVTWWTNIRFEENFTQDLCTLLKASGCIAVSGGLEVASDRLLLKMQKGVTVAQVAKVAQHFTQSGIMVHAYLMYGFPTQSAQETIDSLEMVRQLFENGVLQSGFWHQFAMTAHSPVGLDPAAYGVLKVGPEKGDFAENDYFHEDPQGADHEAFSEGLKKSLFNFMHGLGFDMPLQSWFDFKVPPSSIPKKFIFNVLNGKEHRDYKDNHRLIWLAKLPKVQEVEKIKKGKKIKSLQLQIADRKGDILLDCQEEEAKAFSYILEQAMPSSRKLLLSEAKKVLEEQYQVSWQDIQQSPSWQFLRQEGLLII